MLITALTEASDFTVPGFKEADNSTDPPGTLSLRGLIAILPLRTVAFSEPLPNSSSPRRTFSERRVRAMSKLSRTSGSKSFLLPPLKASSSVAVSVFSWSIAGSSATNRSSSFDQLQLSNKKSLI